MATLVFVSSLAGKAASVGSSLYSATKFGLRGFAAGLREDLHGSGVGVTVVFPGFVAEAGMFADSGVGLPRWVGTRTPDQVAAAVVRGIEHGPRRDRRRPARPARGRAVPPRSRPVTAARHPAPARLRAALAGDRRGPAKR